MRSIGILPQLFTIAIAGAIAAGCAPARIELPASGVASKYPEFLFPSAPADLGSSAAHERHKAGWLWLQAGDLRAAERNFNACLKLAGDFYPASAGLGYVGLAQSDYRKAVEHFDRAVAASPGYVPALVGRGEAQLALGNRDSALESFEAAVASDSGLDGLRSRIEVLRFRGLQEDVAAAREAAEAGRLEEARAAYARALAASPLSPFLHRELAAVDRRAGDIDAAIEHAQKAAELESSDARNLVLIGELQEARGDYAQAVESYDAALALEPDPAVEARIDALREKLLLAELPPEFRAIENAPAVSRADLAALFGIRLGDLLKRVPRRNAAVITDTRGNWASPWILSVTRAGVMEVYPNHTFQPATRVRRADLAQAASRVLSLIAGERPELVETWRSSSQTFPDVSPRNLNYPAASLAVEAGIMRALDDGSFQPTRPVSGAEAVAAVRKLEELSRSDRR
ncbi:MAG TPA: tetratricopeptide repeat protein [Vicinamibacterales bacterium]|nr:tetratricopeptide repeat protein [Vicinamibacterales bacterium]